MSDTCPTCKSNDPQVRGHKHTMFGLVGGIDMSYESRWTTFHPATDMSIGPDGLHPSTPVTTEECADPFHDQLPASSTDDVYGHADAVEDIHYSRMSVKDGIACTAGYWPEGQDGYADKCALCHSMPNVVLPICNRLNRLEAYIQRLGLEVNAQALDPSKTYIMRLPAPIGAAEALRIRNYFNARGVTAIVVASDTTVEEQS